VVDNLWISRDSFRKKSPATY